VEKHVDTSTGSPPVLHPFSERRRRPTNTIEDMRHHLNPPRPSGHYDVVVVGARAAGATIAMLLARRGLRVLAVDKGGYGTDTLSSHALMRGAVTRLHRWGLLDRIWDAGTPVVQHASFRYGGTGVHDLDIDVPAGDGIPGLCAPRRTVLDPILVDAAVAAGAELRHRTRLLRVLGAGTPDSPVHGVELAIGADDAVVVTCDLLVGADGLQSTVARHVDAPVTRQGNAASAYALQYVTGLDRPADTYGWSYGSGVGAGVIPTNDDTWCVFAALPPERFASATRPVAATMLDVLGEVDPSLARALADASPAGPVRSWPGIRGRFRRAHGNGWALVGDAGYFKDPFAAHGISDAFRDAELLADAIVDGDLPRFERLRDELSQPLFDVLERIASYDWDLESLPALHWALSRAMRDEELALAGA
jgi:menaquinone-9 beta-reductase